MNYQNSSRDAIECIYEANKSGIWLWLENGALKLKLPQDNDSSVIIAKIRSKKDEIIEVLATNKVYYSDYVNNYIYKIPADESELSFAQERLWFIEQYEQGTNAYHMPTLWELDSKTNVSALKYALQKLVSRHEVLRSTIRQSENGQCGTQKVHFEELQIDDIVLDGKEDYLAIIRSEINRPFDLSLEYPIRVRFYFIDGISESDKIRTLMLVNIHHIANDGWSTDIFPKELYAYYEAYINHDLEFCLPELEVQYKDYAVWQRAYLKGEVLSRQLNYWKEKLSGFQNLNLPTDYPRPKTVDYRGEIELFNLSSKVSRQLRELVQKYGVTMHSVMLSSINILLGKYSGQNDVVTGCPIANREHPQIQGIIGFFVNTQVNRVLLNNVQTYAGLIKQVHNDQIQNQLFQDIPFEKLVEELGIERDISRNPIFQVSFVVQSFGKQKKANDIQRNYLRQSRLTELYETTKFDLSFYLDDTEEEIELTINYATTLFTRDTILRLVQHYKNLLEGLVANPDRPYSEINLSDSEEYNKIVYSWNSTDKDYPSDSTISKQFEIQAALTPDTVALVYEGRQLSYKQLNERSNQLARHIRSEYEQRVKRLLPVDTPIGIYMERSLEMVTGILAILKAGGAYLPIDTNYPQERIDYMLEDSGSELILSQSELMQGSSIHFAEDKVIYIDNEEATCSKESSANLALQIKSGSLAYVIYTSGTTGRPKGVMVEHGSVLSLVYNDYIDLSADSVFAFFSSPVFDATTFELWTPLLKGHRLIIPADVRNLVSDISRFRKFISINGISVMWLTKTLFESLYYADNEVFSRLEYLLIGGEALDRNIVNKIVTSPSKPGHLLNGYGPTEGTTFTCTFELKAPVTAVNVPIGSPINNRRVYVLDQDMIPVPTGVSGELYIGGAGIARGYLNQPDLTAGRFIPNPFATEADHAKGYTRLYKTGDMVSWLPDGNLEFIGRNDSQVKIRGYRIELGEIEHALSRISGIKQNCVLVKERKTETGIDKYLVGYYIQDSSWQSSNDAEILESWEDLYDTEYDKAVSEDQVESDFTGWNSYITGRPIPIPEMLLWQQSITDIIKSLNPVRILEVGVGSGLLMYPLLDEVQSYAGLDLSQSVIRRHKERLRDKENKTSFYHLKADQIEALPLGEYYDTIIINSVCQYFPGIGYFEEMLAQALAKLSSGGSVFLGDIRNYASHKDLIRDRFAYRGESCSQREIEQIALKENELLISPDYFRRLTKRNEKLEVRVLPRTGIYENELSKYRYDVLIRVKGEGRIINNRFVIDEVPGSDSIWKTGNDHNIPYLNQLSKEDIIRQLSVILPSYMVPATMVVMESFPITINGKLDRQALPDPDFGSPAEGYTAPASEMENTLCRIWQEVLGLECVGVTDNFFRMGGNSILAIQLCHRMSKALGWNVKVVDLFNHYSIIKLLSNKKNYVVAYDEIEI